MYIFCIFLARPKFMSIIHKLAGKGYLQLMLMANPCCFFSKSIYTISHRQQESAAQQAGGMWGHAAAVPWGWAPGEH